MTAAICRNGTQVDLASNVFRTADVQLRACALYDLLGDKRNFAASSAAGCCGDGGALTDTRRGDADLSATVAVGMDSAVNEDNLACVEGNHAAATF